MSTASPTIPASRPGCASSPPISGTWKDLGWLVVNSTVGFALATAAITVTALVISYLLMPLWWWAISDPSTQYGTLNLGIYTVPSTGSERSRRDVGVVTPAAANRSGAAERRDAQPLTVSAASSSDGARTE